MGATGHLDTVKKYTDSETLSFQLGSYTVTAYQILKSIFILGFIFWTAATVSYIAESRICTLKKVRAANRSLLLKAAQIAIYLVSFLLALDIIGVDLTTLTVFSGALGIGLGFGLQKISSNFISGIILLLEKSVEQDDLIEMADGTAGYIRKSNARFTLIETFDGKEIMIPNEDFITGRVVNWTYSNTKARVEIPIGVSYKADLELVQQLILEAATEHTRCIKEPEPKCYLRAFGESSVDFMLHFWVDDITAGRWQPKSEIMFCIWNKFKAHGIEIPFPQRDIHMKLDKGVEALTNG